MAEKKANETKAITLRRRREKRTNARRVFLDPSTPPVLSIVRVVVITLLILSIYEFGKSILSSLTKLFFMIVLAIFFAYLIEPLVKLIRSPVRGKSYERLMPRSVAIVIAYVFVFTILGISIAYLAPRISAQVRQFASRAPQYASSVQEMINNFNSRLERMRISEDVQRQITEGITNFGTSVTTFLGASAFETITYLPWLILVPILAFFFLKDANFFRLSLLRVFPMGRWRSRVESFIFDVNRTLAAYTRAQLISCLLIGTLCTIAFYILGLNYALLLGIMAGALEFIPLLGPLTVGIIVVSFALLQSPWQALYVFIFLVVLRLTHDYVTYPRIVREGIHLHPLAVILSVLAGEQVAGIAGVFLSIPIVALLTVIYKHVLQHSGSKGFFASWLDPKEAKEVETIHP